MRIIHVACVVIVTACTSVAVRPFLGTLPNDIELDMDGDFTFSVKNGLELTLEKPCTVKSLRSIDDRGALAVQREHCSRSRLDNILIVARTPWKQDITAYWKDASHLVFHVDWGSSGLDPLANDSEAISAGPWHVSGVEWQPTAGQATAMLREIGVATQTEVEVVRGGPPPKLEVTSLEIEGDTLRAAEPHTLVVRIKNRGSGAAYRVVATTRSSIKELHGKRLLFGAIGPGAEKARRTTLTVPAAETARDTMLVLAFSEGNEIVPANVSRRFAIAPSIAAPVLAVRCAIVGHNVPRPDVDPGQNLTLHCVVSNTGSVEARQVSVDVALGGDEPARSKSQVVPPAGRVVFEVPATVPRGLPMDTPFEIVVSARDGNSSSISRATVGAVVRKPKLCLPGGLTRDQYNVKIGNMRDLLAAGEVTRAAFDRYDAELVSCLSEGN